MKVISRKLEELHIDPANLRTHDEVNLAAIKASLAKFGQQHPIIVDAKGMVVAGNGRLEAARALGWDTINVVVTDLDALDLAAFAIADNRTAELAGWDGAALAATLRVLAADEEALAATGFDAEALAQALSVPDAEGNPLDPDIDPADTEGAEPSLSIPTEHAPVDPDRTPHASDVSILSGDCRERMAEFQPESFTAIVCDPPYELAFMGKKWDASGIAFDVEVWKQALRVLKPGGYLLAFGGTRTYHRLAVAIEDAGFEVRDCFAWMHGSGFPKSLDVGKAIDKAAGAEREVVGKKRGTRGAESDDRKKFGSAIAATGVKTEMIDIDITAPATDLAREWDGYGTALKPAYEPCIIARKPLIGTVAENVAAHGCGALNVDGARIGTEEMKVTRSDGTIVSQNTSMAAPNTGRIDCGTKAGRWPANVLLDEEAACILDGQSGVTKSGPGGAGSATSIWSATGQERKVGHDDQGGASRFFYTSKASTSERTHDGKVANTHATVKPIAVMRYLINLVRQPKTNRILDPFAGSGTTLVAAIREGLDVVGIELDPEHIKIIEARIAHEPTRLATKVTL